MNFDAMWEALEKYQPYAEKHGFGEAWLRMTTERTPEAAKAVVEATSNVPDAMWTWWAANLVEHAFREEWPAEFAIYSIIDAIERENKS